MSGERWQNEVESSPRLAFLILVWAELFLRVK
jgi:hypothetical protein